MRTRLVSSADVCLRLFLFRPLSGKGRVGGHTLGPLRGGGVLSHRTALTWRAKHARAGALPAGGAAAAAGAGAAAAGALLSVSSAARAGASL